MDHLSKLRELIYKFRSNQISPAEITQLFTLMQLLPDGKQELGNAMDEEAARELECIRQREPGLPYGENDFDAERSRRMQENIFARIGAMQTAATLQERKQKQIQWRLYWQVAAVLLLISGLSLAILYSRQYHAPAIQYSTYTTGTGQIATLNMPDGTVIQLNRNSSIRYPEKFNNHSFRKIELSGEAFFQVAKNPEKPFVITTERAKIQVLGTAFNVKENQHDTTVIVAVREGLVAVSSRLDSAERATQLAQGDIGVLHQTSLHQRKVDDISNYLSWYNGRLIFRNTPLPDVVQQLSQCYDTPIQLQHPDLMKLRLTANMKRDELPAVLEQLALSLNIRYTHKKGTFLLHQK